MRVNGDGWPPPSVAGGMPGGVPGGMPGGSKAPTRGKPGAERGAAELASEAARAEGASIPGERRRQRRAGSSIPPNPVRAVSAELAVGADQAEQSRPLLGMGGDQQP